MAKVQAIATADASVQPLVDAGQAYNWWYTSGLQAYRILGYLPASSFMATSATIKQYPALTQAMVNINLKNILYWQNHPNSPNIFYNGLAAAPGASALITLQQFKEAWPYTRAIYQPLTGLLDVEGPGRPSARRTSSTESCRRPTLRQRFLGAASPEHDLPCECVQGDRRNASDDRMGSHPGPLAFEQGPQAPGRRATTARRHSQSNGVS